MAEVTKARFVLAVLDLKRIDGVLHVGARTGNRFRGARLVPVARQLSRHAG